MFHCCSFQYDCTAVGRYYGLYFSLTVASFPHSSGLEGSVRNPSLFMVMSKASVLSVRVTHLTKLLWCENSAAIHRLVLCSGICFVLSHSSLLSFLLAVCSGH